MSGFHAFHSRHHGHQGRKKAHPHPPMRRTQPQPPEPEPTFVLRNTRAVFDNCNVRQLTACDYSLLGADVRATIQAVASVTPPPRMSHAQRSALQAVFETGRSPKAAVYEVLSKKHPARFYSPPDGACYALLARETIQPREPIGVYVGRVHLAEVFHEQYGEEDRIKQVYAYSMNSELFPKAYTGPSLICESLSFGGNEMRFVNDVWCRRGGERCKNAEATLFFDTAHDNMPVMVICANRLINKGEEILTDYGSGFWNKISTALAREHKNYQDKVEAQLRDMEQRLAELLLAETAPRRTAAAAKASAAAAAASSSGAAAAAPSALNPLSLLPAAPARLSCFRSLYNQYDVLYDHTRPVRLDPVRHADSFAFDGYIKTQQAIRLVQQKEEERQARDLKRQAAATQREEAARAAAEREAAAAQARRTGRLRKPATKLENDVTPALEARATRGRSSTTAAAPAAAVESPPAVAGSVSSSDSVVEIEEHKATGTKAAAAAAAAASAVAASAPSHPAAPASIASLISDDVVQITKPRSAAGAAAASSAAPAPASATKGKKWPNIPSHNFLTHSTSNPTHKCDDCGAPCIPRAYKDKTFIKCRLHYKARITQEVLGEKQGGARKSSTQDSAAAAVTLGNPTAGAASAAVDSAAQPSAPAAAPAEAATANPAKPPSASAASSAAAMTLPAKRAREPSQEPQDERKEFAAAAAPALAADTNADDEPPAGKRTRTAEGETQLPDAVISSSAGSDAPMRD